MIAQNRDGMGLNMGMRWTEITEARQAALYHFMDEFKAKDCFERDAMEAKWSHLIDGRRVKGNSFSRNANFHMPRAIRLVMNQMALSARHKIIPIDGERTFHTTLRKDTDDDREVTIRDRVINGKHDKALQEEFVLGDIAPLSKFISVIEFNDPSNYFVRGSELIELHTLVTTYAEKHGVELRVHPKVIREIDRIHELRSFD